MSGQKKFESKARKHKLTPREAEIVAAMACGEKKSAVAAALKISVHTVDTHLRRVYSKLKIHSITAVVFLIARR